MNNLQAYNALEACSGNTREASEQIACEFKIPETDLPSIRSSLIHLKSKRRDFVKRNDLDTWERMQFCDIPQPITMVSKKRKSSLSLSEPMERLVFEVDPNQEIRTPLLELHSKQLRHRLDAALSHIKSIAELEGVTPKQVASLCLQLIANEEKDYGTSDVCKDIVAKGTFLKQHSILSERNSSFLLDFLSIGKLRYRELRRFLKQDNVYISSYNRVAKYRQDLCLVNEMKYFQKHFETPIGIYIPYQLLVTQTIHQIVEIEALDTVNYPLKAKLTDGLDGSGSHTIYNQLQNHPDLSTKSFLLFAFKVLWIQDSLGNRIWVNPSPNSPFAIRPVALLALGESRENVEYLMDSTINPETKLLGLNGVQLPGGKVNVDITRCLFDTKMAAILDGAGGSSCHLCTATKEQLHDIDLIQQGFPINRSIEAANQIFNEVDEDEFLSLPSKERFGITHKPLSVINILSASPLHGYLRIFGWFMQLVYHLQAGRKKWSPTSPEIRKSMEFVRSFLWEKIGIQIDCPSPQGGTTSTGNVARACFQRVDDDKKDFFTGLSL